ncbi:MAG: hypothetical protein IPN76_35000 [Saprospiraceae bacterium]|nr:hypothetical protein [Saprospiraceae bacterium]
MPIYNLENTTKPSLRPSTIPLCDKPELAKEKWLPTTRVGKCPNQRGTLWLAIEYYDKALEAMKSASVPPHFPVVVTNNIAIICNGLKLCEKKEKNTQSGVFEEGQGNRRRGILRCFFASISVIPTLGS